MFKGIYNVYSVDLQFFRRKDNIKGVQELSTPLLFNIKKANFFAVR